MNRNLIISTVISAILIAIATTTIAQDDITRKKDKMISTQPSGYVGGGIGVGIPLGAFGNAEKDATSGYALGGLLIHTDVAFPIAHSNFGFAANFSYYQNAMDDMALADNLTQAIGKTVSVVASDKYKTSTIMVGLLATIPAKKWSVDFKGLFGLALCSIPSTDVTIFSTSGDKTTTISWDASAAFAYGGGVTVRFAPTKHLCLLLQTSIVSTKPNTTANYSDNTPSSSGSQPITILGLSAGAGYQF